MLLKYVGKAKSRCHSCQGKKVYFGPETDMTQEVPERFSVDLMRLGEYVPVAPKPKVEKQKEVEVPTPDEMVEVAEKTKVADNLPKDSLIPKKRGRPKKAEAK
jgi:hypothetical protein